MEPVIEQLAEITAMAEQEMGNSEWKTGRSDATEVAVTERCLATTLRDQETPFSSTPL